MRVAIIGAGGTGGYFGGLLARAGEDVTLIARGATLAAIQAQGLTVRSRLFGDFTVPVHATDDPRGIEPVDLILVCVKAYDTAIAAESIRPLVGQDTLILSVQNGIDNEDVIARAVGAEHVIGATVVGGGVREEPGVILGLVEPAIVRFGELAGGTSARTDRLVPVLQRAGITAAVHPDMCVGLWEKWIGICAFSGVTSLARQPIGVVMAGTETAMLYRGVLEEAEVIARAKGIAVAADIVERWMSTQQELARTNPNACGSMYYDLVAGRRLEVAVLNGAVVRLGQKYGVPVPLNFAIHAALQPYAQGTSVRA